MTDHETLLTLRYLANELRKAHETAAAQHHVIAGLRAEVDRLKALQSQDHEEAKS